MKGALQITLSMVLAKILRTFQKGPIVAAMLALSVAITYAGEQESTGVPDQQISKTDVKETTQLSSNGGLFGTTANFESGVQTKGADLGVAKGGSQKNEHRGEFAFAPIPLLNPSIGNGIGGAAMYLRTLDSSHASPPSTFAIGGFGTGTGSWGLGVGAKLYLKEDRYRITAGYGGGTFNYNFFGIGPDAGSQGLAIPLSQRSRTYLIEPTPGEFSRIGMSDLGITILVITLSLTKTN